ncbi:hypothetical protein HDV04_002242 [Boothiomyces sp. JEL0838]|nr:hypothetical protein HDV04_002242 [Boothiomyces sp. JEL0838]
MEIPIDLNIQENRLISIGNLPDETVSLLHYPLSFKPDFRELDRCYVGHPNNLEDKLQLVLDQQNSYLELPIEISINSEQTIESPQLKPLTNPQLPGLTNSNPLKEISVISANSAHIPLNTEKIQRIDLHKFEMDFMESHECGIGNPGMFNFSKSKKNYEMMDTGLFPHSSYLSWNLNNCFNIMMNLANELQNLYKPKLHLFTFQTIPIVSCFSFDAELVMDGHSNTGESSNNLINVEKSVENAVFKYFSLRGESLTQKRQTTPVKQKSKKLPKRSNSPRYIYAGCQIIKDFGDLFDFANIIALEREYDNMIALDSKSCLVLMKLSDIFRDVRHHLLKAASKFSTIHISLEFDPVFQDGEVKGIYPFTCPNNAMINETKAFVYGILKQELGCSCYIWHCLDKVQVVDLITSLARDVPLEKEESISLLFLVGFPGMNSHLAQILLKNYSLRDICKMSLANLKEEFQVYSDSRRLVFNTNLGIIL